MAARELSIAENSAVIEAGILHGHNSPEVQQALQKIYQSVSSRVPETFVRTARDLPSPQILEVREEYDDRLLHPSSMPRLYK